MFLKQIHKLYACGTMLMMVLFSVQSIYAQTIVNTCPDATGDLTSKVTSIAPVGTVVTFHTGDPATDANKVTNPSVAEAGTYYAAYWDETNSCYSPVSDPLYVAKCMSNTCPDQTVDLTGVASGASNGNGNEVLEWHTSHMPDASNKVDDITTVGDGTYWAVFYDATNDGCYSPVSSPVIVTIEDCTGSISGNVSEDTTGDGNGDSPLANVILALLDSNGNPVLDSNGDPVTTTTDATGNYTFSDVPAGTGYQIVETDPDGYVSTSDTDGANDNTIGSVDVVGGQDNGDNNFVDAAAATISGNVSADTNGDGTTDTPLANVTIELLDSNGNPVLDNNGDPITTVTDASGNYTFNDVPPGNYQIKQQQPDGYVSLDDTDGNATENIIAVDATTPGSTISDQSFEETQTGSISGNVSEDTRGDGLGDSPLANVTLSLLDSNGNPVLDSNGEPITATTDANGNYTFSDVPAGTGYQIVETDPDGYVSTSDTDGANDNTIGSVDVIGGQDNGDNNFVDAAAATISGNVSADTNGDGTTDTPLANVTIELLDSNGNPVLDSNGDPITTVTDASGNYTFNNVPPGNYQIKQQQPEGYTSTNDSDGNDTENIISVNASTPGADVSNQNFEEETMSQPINLISFNAVKRKDDVVLNWITASEVNNAKFIIEYSYDGYEFKSLTTMKGSGNSSVKKSYTCLHEKVEMAQFSIIYYRLKQVDFDGTEYEYPIVSVRLYGSKVANIFPNPVIKGSEVYINHFVDADLGFKVYDQIGRIVLVDTISKGSAVFSTESLKSGFYMILFDDGGTVSFIVN